MDTKTYTHHNIIQVKNLVMGGYQLKHEYLMLGENGITIKKCNNVFNIIEIDIPYNKITNIVVHKGFLGKFYGDISILSANVAVPEIFKYVANPQEIKEEINKRINH